jgi:hypothetical protein
VAGAPSRSSATRPLAFCDGGGELSRSGRRAGRPAFVDARTHHLDRAALTGLDVTAAGSLAETLDAVGRTPPPAAGR